MEFAKLKKADLVQVATQLQQENKELRKAIKNVKENADKPYNAVSVAKIDGDFCAIKVRFGEEDIESYEPFDTRPHMADFTAKRYLQEIIHKGQQIDKEL